MPFARNGEVHIHYERLGEGPPLVLQHGFFWSLEGWHQYGYVEALRAHFGLILIDARGHGRSDKPHARDMYTLRHHVDDLVAVLDEEQLPEVLYWGYSMGGWFGYGLGAYALDRVNAMVLGGAHPYGRQLGTEKVPDGTDADEFVSAFFKRAGLDRNTFSEDQLAEFYDNDFRALAAANGDRESLEPALPSMSIPILLYTGGLDGAREGVQRASQQLNNCEYEEVPGCNHPESFYRSDLVLPFVLRFLAQ